MDWFPVAALGVAVFLGMVALLLLGRAVRGNTRAVDAMRVILERDCGAGDDQ